MTFYSLKICETRAHKSISSILRKMESYGVRDDLISSGSLFHDEEPATAKACSANSLRCAVSRDSKSVYMSRFGVKQSCDYKTIQN